MAGDPEGDPEGYPEGEYGTTEPSEKDPRGIVADPDANTEALGSCDCDEVPNKLPNMDGEAEEEPEEEPEGDLE
jgi:hypothetical protein